MSDADYAGSQGGGRSGSGGAAPSEGEQSTTYRESAITEVRTRRLRRPGRLTPPINISLRPFESPVRV